MEELLDAKGAARAEAAAAEPEAMKLNSGEFFTKDGEDEGLALTNEGPGRKAEPGLLAAALLPREKGANCKIQT